MNSSRPRFAGLIGWTSSTLVFAAFSLVLAAPHACAQHAAAGAGFRDASVDEYVEHLRNLDAIVSSCQTQRAAGNGQSAAKIQGGSQLDFPACDAAQVGLDDRVQWPSGAGTQAREVRYDWLRSVLRRATKKSTGAQTDVLNPIRQAKTKPVTVDPLLTQAHDRLQADLKQAVSPVQTTLPYADERKALNAILAQKAYKGVTELSPRERFLEWLSGQIDRFLAGLMQIGERAPWIGLVLRILLIAGACTVLILLVVRIERQGRVRLIPDELPAPEAPSAREWQLWLRDAQETAAKGQWREAIHFLYWASISRLESRRLWPADRARTPREYLLLLPGSDLRKPALAELTRKFERTWYGGHPAAAFDFGTALDLVRALGVAKE